MSDTVDDKVGYKRPPKHAQFKRGQSGNRSGRPKGRRNLKLDLAEELSKTVSIQKDGRSRRVSKQRAFVETLVNGAIAGNPQFARLLISLCGQTLDGELNDQPDPKAKPIGYTEAELEALLASAAEATDYRTLPVDAEVEAYKEEFRELRQRPLTDAERSKFAGKSIAQIQKEYDILRKLPPRW